MGRFRGSPADERPGSPATTREGNRNSDTDAPKATIAQARCDRRTHPSPPTHNPPAPTPAPARQRCASPPTHLPGTRAGPDEAERGASTAFRLARRTTEGPPQRRSAGLFNPARTEPRRTDRHDAAITFGNGESCRYTGSDQPRRRFEPCHGSPAHTPCDRRFPDTSPHFSHANPTPRPGPTPQPTHAPPPRLITALPSHLAPAGAEPVRAGAVHRRSSAFGSPAGAHATTATGRVSAAQRPRRSRLTPTGTPETSPAHRAGAMLGGMHRVSGTSWWRSV